MTGGINVGSPRTEFSIKPRFREEGDWWISEDKTCKAWLTRLQENGVAIIQEGDAEGKNGEYDNKYVWIFKMKDGLIYSLREYNSDILVATQLYDYKLTPIDN